MCLWGGAARGGFAERISDLHLEFIWYFVLFLLSGGMQLTAVDSRGILILGDVVQS